MNDEMYELKIGLRSRRVYYKEFPMPAMKEGISRIHPEKFGGMSRAGRIKEGARHVHPANQEANDARREMKVRRQIDSMAAPVRKDSVPPATKAALQEPSVIQNSWEENKTMIDENLKKMPLKTRIGERVDRALDKMWYGSDDMLALALKLAGLMDKDEYEKRKAENKQDYQSGIVGRDLSRSMKSM